MYPDHYPIFVAADETVREHVQSKLVRKINYRKLLEIASTVNWNQFKLHDPNIGIVLK